MPALYRRQPGALRKLTKILCRGVLAARKKKCMVFRKSRRGRVQGRRPVAAAGAADSWSAIILGENALRTAPYGAALDEPAGFRLADAGRLAAPPSLPASGGAVPAPSALWVIAGALAMGRRRRR